MCWSGLNMDRVAKAAIDKRWWTARTQLGLDLPPLIWHEDDAHRPVLGGSWMSIELDGMRVVRCSPKEMMKGQCALVQSCIPEMLSLQMVQAILDRWRAREPLLIQNLIPAHISLHQFTMLLRRLVREGFGIHAMRAIIETVMGCAPGASLDTQHVAVRLALGAQIAEKIRDMDEPVMLIDLNICNALQQAFRVTPPDPPRLALSPEAIEDIIDAIDASLADNGLFWTHETCVCVTLLPGARMALQWLLGSKKLRAVVASLDEIAPHDHDGALLKYATTVRLRPGFRAASKSERR